MRIETLEGGDPQQTLPGQHTPGMPHPGDGAPGALLVGQSICFWPFQLPCVWLRGTPGPHPDSGCLPPTRKWSAVSGLLCTPHLPLSIGKAPPEPGSTGWALTIRGPQAGHSGGKLSWLPLSALFPSCFQSWDSILSTDGKKNHSPTILSLPPLVPDLGLPYE